MTTLIEIVDTAVKIGLGALITGVSSYLLSRSDFKNEVRKSSITELRNMVKDLAFKIEAIESKHYDVAHCFHNSDLDSARKHVLVACSEAHHARAISNIIGSDKVTEIIDSCLTISQNMYHELREQCPNLDVLKKLEEDLSEKIKSTYPFISKLFLQPIA